MGKKLPETPSPNVKTDKFWTAKQAIIISSLAYFVAQVFVAIPIIAYTVVTDQATVDEDFLGQPWVSLVLTGISAVGLIATLLLFFRYKKISIKKLGFKKLSVKTVGLVPAVYFVYAFLLVFTIAAIGALFPEFNVDQAQDVGFKDAQGWQLGLAFLGLVVIAPIAEEMLFRGFLYKGLKNTGSSKLLIGFGLAVAFLVGVGGGVIAGVVVAFLSLLSAYLIGDKPIFGAAIFTSMLFGIVHMQWNVAIDTFILSLVLIWLLEKTNNLWAPVLLHALKNFIAFIFVFEIITITGF